MSSKQHDLMRELTNSRHRVIVPNPRFTFGYDQTKVFCPVKGIKYTNSGISFPPVCLCGFNLSTVKYKYVKTT